jgi:hypothetical protein
VCSENDPSQDFDNILSHAEAVAAVDAALGFFVQVFAVHCLVFHPVFAVRALQKQHY